MIESSSPATFSTTASLLVVLLVLLVLAFSFAWALRAWRAQVRHASEAVARVITRTPPARGSVVLRGVVETAQPDRPAITVKLWENGTERQTKSGWVHTWTEERREVHAEPFDLWLEGAVAVRIEPDDDVFLVDALDAIEPGNPRIRRAELTNGETAYVTGIMVAGDTHA